MPTQTPKRPSKIRVGYTTFIIEWLDDTEWSLANENDDWGGVTYHERSLIRVRLTGGRSEDNLRETLLHEITHAVWSTRGLNLNPFSKDEDTQEEYTITCQSGGLLQAFSDNPSVTKYLFDVK